MKQLIQTLCALAVGLIGLTSCLGGDDDEITSYSDIAITQFTLGTLNRYTQTTSPTTGNDTVVKTTLTGTAYKMTIDHLGGSIYNQQELPVGTDVRHVICTITTKHSGVAALKSLTSDSLTYINSKDSLDFSVPRVVRVFAIDGSAYRDYTITLNVSKTAGTNFGWTKVAAGRADLTGWTNKHLVAMGDSVMLVDRGTMSVVNQATGTPMLMRLSGSGDIETSVDGGVSWTVLAAATGLQSLLGATPHELYALGGDGHLKCSADGLSWTDETLDDDDQLLPTSNIDMVSWPYAPADSTDYVLMVGRLSSADTFTVWHKLSSYATMPIASKWVYMVDADDNHYTLPYADNLSLAYYDGQVFAVRGSDRTIYVSRDQGISWRSTTSYALPTAMGSGQLVMTTDSRGRLWVVTASGELWRGDKL